MDKKLLEILACPLCKGALQHNMNTAELICRPDRLAFPIKEDVPVMLASEARKISLEELEKLK